MSTIIQMPLITEEDWPMTTKKAKELQHIIRKCNPPAAALPTLAKGTTVPGLYSHIAHSNDKDEAEIPQPFKGAHPKQPKPRGRGKGKQPQQKPKNPPQTGHCFRGQNFCGRGQRNQNTYQGQYQNDGYQSNNYQGN